MHIKPITLAVTSLALVGSAVDQAEAAVIFNPSFEAPVDGFTGWQIFGPGWRIGGPGDANTGNAAAVNDVLATDAQGSFRGVQQRITTGFLPGESYSLSAFVGLASNETTTSFLQLQYLDATDEVLATIDSPVQTEDQALTLVETDFLEVPTGTATIRVGGIVFYPADGAAITDTDFHIFDDFAITAIPEPTTATIGLMGLGMMAARRRR